jgi:hypothetical protein
MTLIRLRIKGEEHDQAFDGRDRSDWISLRGTTGIGAASWLSVVRYFETDQAFREGRLSGSSGV